MALSKRVRYEVLRRDNYRCRYCGATAETATLTVDHVLPVALGGIDNPSNLVAACADCNSGKTSTGPSETTVAQVSDDAARWAAAIAVVAEQMLREQDETIEYVDEFLTGWLWWTDRGYGGSSALPDAWEASVSAWRAAGLPSLIVLNAIQRAMRNPKVRPGSKFRYIAGICWNRITELQTAARSALIDGPAT
jgi:hypothetical protein